MECKNKEVVKVGCVRSRINEIKLLDSKTKSGIFGIKKQV